MIDVFLFLKFVVQFCSILDRECVPAWSKSFLVALDLVFLVISRLCSVALSSVLHHCLFSSSCARFLVPRPP